MAKICKKCLTINKDSANFCNNCGNKLEDENFQESIDSYVEKLRENEKSLEEKLKKINEELENSIKGVSKKFEETTDASFGQGIGKFVIEKEKTDDYKIENEVQKNIIPDGLKKADLYRDTDFRKLDDLFKDDFNLKKYRWFNRRSFFVPTIYCETLEEFFEPVCKDLEVSESTKKELIEEYTQEAAEKAEVGEGIFGIFIPSQGCFINGWLCCRIVDKKIPPEEGLTNPEVYPHIIRVAAHEKFGHGFLSCFTTYGVESQKIHLYRQRIASNFNIKQSDSPEYTLWNEKYITIFNSSKFTEEGWASYIENYFLEKLNLKKVNSEYSLEDVLSPLSKMEKDKNLPEDIRNLIGFIASGIFVMLSDEKNISEEDITGAVSFLQENENIISDIFQKLFHQKPRYIIGYLLMKKAEEKFGKESLPLLLAIAGNVKYNIENISVSDLQKVVCRNPKFNIDIRMALLTTLNVEKGNLEKIVEEAREKLNFVVPKN